MEQATRELLQRPVAYQAIVAKAVGSVKLALLWGQLYYWSDRGNRDDGWIYKTREDLFEELGLSRKEQETARALGLELGVMDERLMGSPAKMHFKVFPDRVGELIDKYLKENQGGKTVEGTGKKALAEGSLDWVKNISEEIVKEIATKYSTTEQQVKKSADDLVNYCTAKRKKYANYRSALYNFIKLDMARRDKKGGQKNNLTPEPGKYAEFN